MKRFYSILILIAIAGGPVAAQNSINYTIDTSPYAVLPLGSSADLFSTGVGAEASFFFKPLDIPLTGLKAGADFLTLPLRSADAVWAVAAFAGPGFRFPLGERLSLFADIQGGYYYWGSAGWESGVNNSGGFALAAGGGALFRIAGPLTLGAAVSYRYYDALYNGLSISLKARLDFPALPNAESPLRIEEIRLLPLFPVLYGTYDTRPVGYALVKNSGTRRVQEIETSFFVERYMDNPMVSPESFTLEPGESREVPLFALFNEEPMTITEGTKVSARITLSHPSGRKSFQREAAAGLEFYNRNAMTWDDDRKIVSFITAKDPAVMNFAKNAGTWMQDVRNPALDENLQKAAVLFEAVKAYGVRYQVDPSTPFSDFSESAHTVDFLQFPRQTLQYTNGDCDDLTALYAALLEAVGVESAFITIPGHIYAALALKTSPGEARQLFTNPDDLIFPEDLNVEDHRVWLPMEITLFHASFDEAWKTGARQWRERRTAGDARLFPVREAWRTYPAVGFREFTGEITLPNRETVTAALENTLVRHVEQELYPRVEALEKKIRETGQNLRYRHKLALLYARYGLYGKALEGFDDILRTRDYPPAAVNAGNVRYLQGDYEAALAYFTQALRLDTDNPFALLGAARCHYEMENYSQVEQNYRRVAQENPDLARRYAYLNLENDTGQRASAAAETKTIVPWEDAE